MPRFALSTIFALLLSASAPAADIVKFLTGAELTGRVTARDDTSVTIEFTMSGRTFSRKCPLDRVHAVTIGGKREVLNQSAGTSKSGTSPPPRVGPEPPPGAGSRSGQGSTGAGNRTVAQVEALIDQQGRTPPDWWDSVPLEYPRTLDLAWPMPPPKGWNSQRNVGQYVWDVINPNPRKWRSGVRLMHHLLTVHENRPTTRRRAMNELGRMYFALLQDYARAAFWWRKAEVDRGDLFIGNGVRLAECYWKLGNKQMALELSRRLRPQFGMIKLWGDMGETDLALRLADANLRGPYGYLAGTYAGDACRVAGLHQRALKYYQYVVNLPLPSQGRERVERYRQRARANIEAIRLFEMLDLKRVPDGTYRASSPAYAGELHVEVSVRGGRIESVQVTQHKEKQFYSAIDATTRKIVEKQSVRGIDATSSATITSEAIINATAKALSGGMQ